MVTSFGCSCVDGPEATQSPSHWRSCKVQGKMAEDGIDDRSMEVWKVRVLVDRSVEPAGADWDGGIATAA